MKSIAALTGHGLKDPDVAMSQSRSTPIKVKADLDPVRAAILDNLS